MTDIAAAVSSPSKLLSDRFWQNFLPIPPVNGLKLGDRAPDFCLTEVASRQPLHLSHYWGEVPVILAFTRIFTERHYCPLCFPHLVVLSAAYDKFQAAGAQLLLITSTDLDQSQAVVNDLALPMPVLSDPRCQVFQQYGTGQAIGAPLPAQFVLDRYGRIRFWHRFSFLSPNAEPTQLLYALATLPS